MDRDGVPRSRIARELGAGRNTVAKYADMRDMLNLNLNFPHSC